MQATALSPRSLRLPSRLLRAAPDDRLVAALRRGDEKAFETIYDRHHRALLAFCRHMLGSHEEAEDALQRVFVSAHRHLCDGSAHVNLKPWLYTIARNRCLSMLRARRETLALDDVHEPSCKGLALADEVELGEDLKEMLGDIARLPEDQRAALVLAELGDLSQQEIAADPRRPDGQGEGADLPGPRGAGRVAAGACRELPGDLRAARDAERERAAPRPDPPPPRGVPVVHGLRGRGQAPARRALAAAPGDPGRGAQAQRAHRRVLRRPRRRSGGRGWRRGRGPPAPARPGSPSRGSSSPRSRSARAAAASSRCASSISPGRSSAPRRRRPPTPGRRGGPVVSPPAAERRLGLPAASRRRSRGQRSGRRPQRRRARPRTLQGG